MITHTAIKADPGNLVQILESPQTEYAQVTPAPGSYVLSAPEVTVLGKKELKIDAPPPVWDGTKWVPQVIFDMRASQFRMRSSLVIANNIYFLAGQKDLFDVRDTSLDTTGCTGACIPGSKARAWIGRGRSHWNCDTDPSLAGRPKDANGRPVPRDVTWDWSTTAADAFIDSESAHCIELRAQAIPIDGKDGVVWDRVVIRSGTAKQAIAMKTGTCYLRNVAVYGSRLANGKRPAYGIWSSRAQSTCIEIDPNPFGLEVGVFGFDTPIFGNASLVTTRGPAMVRDYRCAFGKDGGMVSYDVATSLDAAGQTSEKVRKYVNV